MKTLTLFLSYTFLLMSATLGITGEDPDMVAYYPFEGNPEDVSGQGYSIVRFGYWFCFT